MSEIPDRINGEIIEAEHVNTNKDRTVQRYTSASQRASLMPVAVTGDVAWLDDVNQLTIYDGSGWIVAGEGVFLELTGGTMTGDLRGATVYSDRFRDSTELGTVFWASGVANLYSGSLSGATANVFILPTTQGAAPTVEGKPLAFVVDVVPNDQPSGVISLDMSVEDQFIVRGTGNTPILTILGDALAGVYIENAPTSTQPANVYMDPQGRLYRTTG